MVVPLLDVCLIVRDEERALPRCLASLQPLQPLVGAVCMYDTGSTDSTVAVARDAGCHVVEGYWDDDFARARNESLAMATAPWALIVDADDEVLVEPAALAREVRRMTTIDVVNARFAHVDERGITRSHSTRFAAVRPDRVRFTSAVHEVPARLDGGPTVTSSIASPVLSFRHWGYAGADLRRAKASRNMASAELALARARASGDAVLVAETLFHRGRTRLLLDDHEGAERDLLDAFDLACGAGSDLWPQIAVQATLALLKPGDTERTLGVAARVGEMADGRPLAQMIVARVLLSVDRPREALDLLLEVPDAAMARPGLGVDQLYGLRLRAARACGQADRVLAMLLVRVGRQGELELVPQLMEAWGDQDPRLLGELLRSQSPADEGRLKRALAAAGARGQAAAEVL